MNYINWLKHRRDRAKRQPDNQPRPMTDQEYREFLTSLFERYVRPRLPRVRRRLHHRGPMGGEEWCHRLEQAQRVSHVLRYIEAYCDDDSEIYWTFTPERLTRTVSDTRCSLQFSGQMAEEAGFLDAFEAHADDILSGLQPQHLPEADRELFREMGSPNPDLELRAVVLRAKAYRERLRQDSREFPVRQQLKHAGERMSEAQEEFKKTWREDKAEQQVPKSRRWFKGLGQIAQGAALIIADVALAAGVFPVSPETRTWGAVASASTGIGSVLSGVGDLRNE